MDVQISSAQVSGAIGTLLFLLLGIIGWFIRQGWMEFNTRLTKIEENTRGIPSLELRLQGLERWRERREEAMAKEIKWTPQS